MAYHYLNPFSQGNLMLGTTSDITLYSNAQASYGYGIGGMAGQLGFATTNTFTTPAVSTNIQWLDQRVDEIRCRL